MWINLINQLSNYLSTPLIKCNEQNFQRTQNLLVFHFNFFNFRYVFFSCLYSVTSIWYWQLRWGKIIKSKSKNSFLPIHWLTSSFPVSVLVSCSIFFLALVPFYFFSSFFHSFFFKSNQLLGGNEPSGLWGLGKNMSHDALLYTTPTPYGIMSDKEKAPLTHLYLRHPHPHTLHWLCSDPILT